MIEASELLASYVQGIRDLSGARTVSLFVPAPLSGLSEPILIHEGEARPLEELVDLEIASRFLERAEEHRTTAALNGVGGPVALEAEAAEGVLIGLPSVEYLWSEASQQKRREGDDAEALRAPAAWLGLRFSEGEQGLDRLAKHHLPAKLATDEARAWWNWLFAMGGALSSHTSQVASIFKDPVTGLPDRAGFQAILTEELEKSRMKKRSLSLLLVNPDDFATVNERFGREAGDQVVREISHRLRDSIRATDAVARYGGVIFSVVLFGTPPEEVSAVAEKILRNLAEGAYLDGAVRLGFSIGTVGFDPSAEVPENALDLIRRADQALNTAKRHGGGCIAEWEHGSVAAENGAFDRLSGIFTGNMAKDYRNMVLLSDALDVISVHQDFEGLASAAIERIYAAFKPERAGLFARDDEGELSLIHGLTRLAEPTSQQRRIETVELGPQLDERVRLAAAAGEPCEEVYTRPLELNGEESMQERICCVLPLIASGSSLGCLFLDGPQDALELESSDLIFLKALASQLAVALDRSRLAELERRRQEGEKKQLKAELNGLRQALRQSKLVYRSNQIEQVVATARRVAPTDATVLITGESGTGKELLARTVHELSPRRHLPLVIVDCGAIATTLMESELFGHEKGAYTGAQGRRVGRLAEADGGTVLLDEIGELPLEVQSKLLRFVQEKQFTTVGGTKTRRVDVRILAATNRDLAAEVKAGRFREDLYYRLNVVRLEVPPLRHRPDDVLHLSRHFVEAFSIQYQKNVHRLTPEAERKLLSYSWPGNVRELQNRLMQAVILCETEELGAGDLLLPAEPSEAAVGTPMPEPPTLAVPPTTAAPLGGGTYAVPGEPVDPALPDPDQAWAQLRDHLGREIDLALGGVSRTTLPLGKWLSDDLILEAHAASDGVARRGAALVGIPETTFRRRLSRASDQARAGLSPRSGTWAEVRSVLAEIVRADGDSEKDLLTQGERILLEEIIRRVPSDTRTGSGLLGVTPPTYRGRLAQLSAAG